MAKRRKPALPACGNLVVDQWFERDRAMVHVKTKDTEKTVAEWWDDDVGQMVEDGFFKTLGFRGKRGAPIDDRSVLEYLAYRGDCQRSGPGLLGDANEGGWAVPVALGVGLGALVIFALALMPEARR